jgi:hypothetical protein
VAITPHLGAQDRLDGEHLDRRARRHEIGNGELAVLAAAIAHQVDGPLAVDVVRGDQPLDLPDDAHHQEQAHPACDHRPVRLRKRRVGANRGGGDLPQIGHHVDGRHIGLHGLGPDHRRLADDGRRHAHHRQRFVGRSFHVLPLVGRNRIPVICGAGVSAAAILPVFATISGNFVGAPASPEGCC